MNTRLLSRSLLLVFLLSGCSSTVMTLPEPTDQDLNLARFVLKQVELSPKPAATDFETQVEASQPVRTRIRLAAVRVCHQVVIEGKGCETLQQRSVLVINDPETINAYVDEHHQVHVFTGLMDHLGTGHELAGVVAHEYAHILFGHVGKKQSNMLTGGLLAMAVLGAVAVGNDLNLNPSAYQSAGDLGALVGSRAYSPEMELEADRLAVHILKEAGYPLRSMRDALIRLSRTQIDAESSGTAARIGFLETHPSDDRRIAHVLQAIEDAEAGLAWNMTLIRQE